MKTIKFERRGKSREDGTAQIYAVLYIDREKIRIPSGVRVSEAEWNQKEQTVKGRSALSRDKNLILSQLLAKINDIFVRARLAEEKVTKNALLSSLRNYHSTKNFVGYCRKHLKEMENGITTETWRQHKSIIDKFEGWKPEIMIGEITPELLRSYIMHLRTVHGNNPTTVHKNISTLRTHFAAAVREGLAKGDPFAMCKVSPGQTEIIYLEEEELDRMIKLYYSGHLPDGEQEILRFFLFMVMTGMHFSDALGLQISDIRNNEIHYTRKKTHINVVVPLSEPAKKLVAHYRGGRLRGPLFQTIPTNQCFNRLIKIVASKADIDKPVCAKTARHTFATLFNKRGGGDLGTLARLLGHTTVKHVLIYAHITSRMKEKGVSVFNNLMK